MGRNAELAAQARRRYATGFQIRGRRMSTNKCAKCGFLLRNKGDKCPNCGTQQAEPKKQAESISGVSAFLILAFLMGALYLLFSHSQNSPPKVSTPPTKIITGEQRIACNDAIRASVKNKKTLNIHDVLGTDWQVQPDNSAIIKTHFEAQNDFGVVQEFLSVCEVSASGVVNNHQVLKK